MNAIAPLPGIQAYPVFRTGAGMAGRAESDYIAREVAVALEFNGISHATLMATPADLGDFVMGFACTEGIIRSPADLHEVAIVEQAHGMVIQATIASACMHRLKQRRRSLAGRTGCGLCGIESLEDVQRDLAPLAPRPGSFSTEAILSAVEQLRARQTLHDSTGATHAAAWADSRGVIQHLREDVGRHNALDKLIGHHLKAGGQGDGMAIISSRASFEMVQKAAAAGMSALVAVSAPTSYAIDLAQKLNIMLAGFARGTEFTVYSHHEFLQERSLP